MNAHTRKETNYQQDIRWRANRSYTPWHHFSLLVFPGGINPKHPNKIQNVDQTSPKYPSLLSAYAGITSRSQGEAERYVGSLCMIGPGLVVVEKFFRRHRRRRRRPQVLVQDWLVQDWQVQDWLVQDWLVHYWLVQDWLVHYWLVHYWLVQDWLVHYWLVQDWLVHN